MSASPSVPGSMSGMTTPAVDVWFFREATGEQRLMRVEDYGPGRVWVQDVMHPTGFGRWEDRKVVEAVNRLP